MEAKHVVHERFVHEPADGERTRVRWNLPLGRVLGRVGVALLLALGLALFASAGTALRWIANPREGGLETIVFTEPTPLLHTWYPIVLAYALLVALLPRGPWPPLVACTAALFAGLVWFGVEAPAWMATPGTPDGAAAASAGALLGWDTPPLQHAPTTATAVRTILGALLVCAAVMMARDFQVARLRPNPGGTRRLAGALCVFVVASVLAWAATLAFVAGDVIALDGALSPVADLFTPVPAEERWEELLLGLVLLLLPVGYVAAHAARSLLDAPLKTPRR